MLALYLKSRGDTVALGDLLQSITMLRLNSAESKLEEVARDFSSNYMRAIEIVDDNTFLGAEDHQNIFLVRRTGGTLKDEAETGRLEHFAEYHTGEQINVFCHGTLSNRPAEQAENGLVVAQSGASIASVVDVETPQFSGSRGQSILFGTCSGAIGCILTIDEATFKFVSALEKCIQSVVHGIGGLSHVEWRSFVNDRKYGSKLNFVDGDLVEMFLELSVSDMAKVVSLLNDELDVLSGTVEFSAMTIEQVQSRVEELSRYH
jgi:DNA damage-binding protein 1